MCACGIQFLHTHWHSCIRWSLVRTKQSRTYHCVWGGRALGVVLLGQEEEGDEMPHHCRDTSSFSLPALPPLPPAIVWLNNGAWCGVGVVQRGAWGPGNRGGGGPLPPLSMGGPLAGSTTGTKQRKFFFFSAKSPAKIFLSLLDEIVSPKV